MVYSTLCVRIYLWEHFTSSREMQLVAIYLCHLLNSITWTINSVYNISYTCHLQLSSIVCKTFSTHCDFIMIFYSLLYRDLLWYHDSLLSVCVYLSEHLQLVVSCKLEQHISSTIRSAEMNQFRILYLCHVKSWYCHEPWVISIVLPKTFLPMQGYIGFQSTFSEAPCYHMSMWLN